MIVDEDFTRIIKLAVEREDICYRGKNFALINRTDIITVCRSNKIVPAIAPIVAYLRLNCKSRRWAGKFMIIVIPGLDSTRFQKFDTNRDRTSL